MSIDFKNKLSKILRPRNGNDIKEHNLPYYYTKYPEWNREYEVKPMYKNIKEFDYTQPLINLHCDNELIELAKKYSGSKILDNNPQLDQIMMEYIKCRPEAKILTIWYKINYDKIIEYLETIGHVYYAKYIKISYKAAKALIYQLFADTEYCKDMESIEKQLSRYQFDKNKDKKYGYITVIIFDNEMKKNDDCLGVNINQIISRKDAYYLTNKFYQTIEHSQIYLCSNSIQFLENQALERHINVNMRKSRILLATFKRWLAQNTILQDRRGFLIFSGAILYVYGLRNIHDIDLYIDHDCYSKNVDKYLLNTDTKFYFLDTTMPYTDTWKKYWDNWSLTWAQLMGAKDFQDVLYNPKYHFYYMGMKFMCLQGDIERRLIRQRPRSLVDLIKINDILDMKIKIPSIPMIKKSYIHLKKDDEIPELQDNQKYNEENREIESIDEIDLNKFLGTMQWYFKTMYHEERDIVDIKPLVGIRSMKLKIKKN